MMMLIKVEEETTRELSIGAVVTFDLGWPWIV